jgi:hypothetical protein
MPSRIGVVRMLNSSAVTLSTLPFAVNVIRLESGFISHVPPELVTLRNNKDAIKQ